MNLDYEKLFAVGNIIGLKNKSMNYVFVHRIHPEKVNDILKAEADYPVDWGNYKNSKLSWSDMEIEYIIKPNEDWSVVGRLFIRDRDMPKNMPKLEQGMMVEVHPEMAGVEDKIGIVSGDKVVYSKGGWNYLDDFDNYGRFKKYSGGIVVVYKANCFNCCDENHCIWERKEA